VASACQAQRRRTRAEGSVLRNHRRGFVMVATVITRRTPSPENPDQGYPERRRRERQRRRQ
jgi:hypothetical protein